MAWISVHKSADGPKLRDLRKKLKASKFESIGILVYLWWWGLDNAEKDGHILHADKEDIEECLAGAGVGCKIPASTIVEALIETGWIDDTEKGYYIHDWEVWQEQWYKAKERREHDAKRKRESRAKGSSSGTTTTGRDSPTDSPQDGHEESQLTILGDSAETTEARYSVGFEAFWKTYPRKIGKGEAYKKYLARIKSGFSEEELLLAAQNYALQCKRLKTENMYIKHPKTFLSDSTPFIDYLPKQDEEKTEENVSANPFDKWKEA